MLFKSIYLKIICMKAHSKVPRFLWDNSSEEEEKYCMDTVVAITLEAWQLVAALKSPKVKILMAELWKNSSERPLKLYFYFIFWIIKTHLWCLHFSHNTFYIAIKNEGCFQDQAQIIFSFPKEKLWQKRIIVVENDTCQLVF